MRFGLLTFALSVMVTATAAAAGQPWQGHIKLQQQYATTSDESVTAAQGYQDIHATDINYRLMGGYLTGPWEFKAHYVMEGTRGDSIELQKEIKSAFPYLNTDRDTMQWMPTLKDIFITGEQVQVSHGLDRFVVSHSSRHLVVKLGRQALSWSNGLVFRPMDLFNPFAPDAIDTSYKPGTDMLYGQWLFDNGSDLAALVVPRRESKHSPLEEKLSSAAIKWHGFGQTLQTDVMVAKDYEDTVMALGLNGPWKQALWRLTVVPTFLKYNGTRTSLVANIENAWQWGDKNVSGYMEYYRNGFGRSDRHYTLQQLPFELTERLARGQVFNTGRDYLATGMRIQWTPLLNVNPLAIINLNDASGQIVLEGDYSLTQNITLDFGASLAIGPKGTEFGGIETINTDTFDQNVVYLQPPTRVYVRVGYYF